MSYFQRHIFFCQNVKSSGKKCCGQLNTGEFTDYFKARLNKSDLHGQSKNRVSFTGCLGRCKAGPCIVMYPEGIWYSYSNFDDLDEIFQRHILEGEVVNRLIIEDKQSENS